LLLLLLLLHPRLSSASAAFFSPGNETRARTFGHAF
jgi:hypothetical protein